MEQKKYTKLSELVDKDFTVEEAYGYTFKKWDADAKRMLTSEKYEQGFRKIYTIKTNEGTLDLGSGQLSSLLEAVYHKGTADINGKTFHVKSNGKSGMDIRYYFNAVRDPSPSKGLGEFADELEESPISVDDIPF